MVAIDSGTKGDRMEESCDKGSRVDVKGAVFLVAVDIELSTLDSNRLYAGDLPYELRLSAGVLRKAGGGALLVTCLREAISLWLEWLPERARGVWKKIVDKEFLSQSAPVAHYK